MSKRNKENLPVRSLESSLPKKTLLRFEITRLQAEQGQQRIEVEAHRHDYYHILFIQSGQGTHTIDFKTYAIQANSLFFVSPGQAHALEMSANTEAYVITFDTAFYLLNNKTHQLSDYPFFHSMSNTPVIHLPDKDEKAQHLINEMLEEYEAAEESAANVLQAFLEILLLRASRLYKGTFTNSAHSHSEHQIRKLEGLIDKYFRTHKKLDEYASMMSLSPKHLNALCKKSVNKTVTNLIHERSILEAKRLLLFTDLSISEIAFDLGFADKSYFMRFFKKHQKRTADEFRKQQSRDAAKA